MIAKLTRPRLAGAVRRERLFATLDVMRTRHAGLCVVAPPGAGKTTLVASWLDARRLGGVWYQVDSGDRDLPSFFHYLGLAAVGRARRVRPPLPSLTPEYADNVAGFSRRFFRGLFERLPRGGCVVLDNYQELGSDSPLHALLADAMEEVPAGTLLIAISRRDPPDTYARLVANERVSLVDWSDLRLTIEEAREIATARLAVPADVVTDLHARSDGWAAGFTLLLEGRRRHSGQGPEAKISIPTDRETLFDYFAAQIFARESPDTRRFLVTTAALPQVPVSIARELTGNPRAQEILQDLHRRHLFTHRRATAEPVYWYHALFRDFLQQQALPTLGHGHWLQTLGRAAHLLEGAGDPDSAFDLYRRAVDWDAAARLAERCAGELVAHGRGRVLQDWLRALPESLVRDSAWLRYWLGVSLTPFDPVQARVALQSAFDDFGRQTDHRGLAATAAALIDCCIFEWSDFHPLAAWVDTLALALARLHLDDDPVFEQRLSCSLLLGMLYSNHDHPGLPSCVQRVSRVLVESLPPNDRLATAMMLLAYCNLTSNATLGRAVGRLGEELVTRPEITPFTRMWWLIRFGNFLRLDGKTERALAALSEADAIAREHGFNRITTACLIGTYSATATEAAGDHQATLRHCRRVIAAASTDSPMARYHVAQARLYMAWAHGDFDAAVPLGRTAIELGRATGMPFVTVGTRAMHAASLALTGRHEELRVLLAEQRQYVEGTVLQHFVLEAELLEAWVEVQTRPGEANLQRLAAALRRSHEREQWYMSGLPATPLMTAMLRATANILGRSLVTDMVQALDLRPPKESARWWPWPVRIRTLGTFEIEVRDVPIRFLGKVPRKPLAILKAVIAFGAQAVPVSAIVDALWPDDPGDSGYKAFTVALARLRKLVGIPEFIAVTDESVSLNPSVCWVDAQHFLATTAPGAQGFPAAEEFSDIGGEFLPAENNAPWAIVMRERLRARFLTVVEVFAHEAERTGEWADALSWYRRGMDADMLAESYYSGAMRCLQQLGRPAEALATFHRLRTVLSAVLDLPPSQETRALAAMIRSEVTSVDDL